MRTNRSAVVTIGVAGIVAAATACGTTPALTSTTGASPIPQTTTHVDTAAAPTTTVVLPPAAPRSLPAPIAGDTEMLPKVRRAFSSWTEARGTLGALAFEVHDDHSSRIDAPDGQVSATMADGTRAEILPALKQAKLMRPVASPLGSGASKSIGSIPEGVSYTPRLAAETPTTDDTLNLMLAPSYWARIMVEPNATSIDSLGPETISKRPAHKYQIRFGGPAAAKYGKEGWYWWVDDETGVLLRVELTAADLGGKSEVHQLDGLDFTVRRQSLKLPDIPSGFDVESLAPGADQKPRALSVKTQKVTPADEVLADTARAGA